MTRARLVTFVVTLAICWGLIGLAWHNTSILIAQGQGGPLFLTASGTGTVSDTRRDLWLGFGLRNESRRPLVVERITMTPICLLCPQVEVRDVFFIAGEFGPPPTNDDPRLAESAFDPHGFVIPPGRGCGGFAWFRLSPTQTGDAGNVNLYRLLVDYRLPGSEKRSYYPPVYFIVFVEDGP